MSRDDRTGDLFGFAHGNQDARDKLAAELRGKSYTDGADTRKRNSLELCGTEDVARRITRASAPETSLDAARRIAPTLNEKQKMVEAHYLAAGKRGCTQSELHEQMTAKLGERSYGTFRTRVSELVNWLPGPRLVRTEVKRDNAGGGHEFVYVHVDFWTGPVPKREPTRAERIVAAARALLEAADRMAYEHCEPIMLAERDALRGVL